MDALLAAAVEEVALEGRAGCSPGTLWQRLSERMFPVPETLKPLIWQELRNMPQQIQFTTAGLLAPRYAQGRFISCSAIPIYLDYGGCGRWPPASTSDYNVQQHCCRRCLLLPLFLVLNCCMAHSKSLHAAFIFIHNCSRTTNQKKHARKVDSALEDCDDSWVSTLLCMTRQLELLAALLQRAYATAQAAAFFTGSQACSNQETKLAAIAAGATMHL